MTLRVLIVEDEEVAAQAHAEYVGRVAGFEVAGVARSGAEALRHLRADPDVDLVLLDMHLPDGHGLGLLQQIRAEGRLPDVIAVTSARDLEVVRKAVAQGVVQYLLKPFSFAGLRGKLERYADYKQRLGATDDEVVQHEVDQLIGMLRTSGSAAALPKGMSADTLKQVTVTLRAKTQALSASEVASAVGSSRVTARRYLEHLADAQLVERQVRYGGGGRPEVEYRWRRGAQPA
ncbi:MAG TPA: response regulator [Nocardioidaceae bacterium]|nr:response regulator [Nocardioidaceae bacterium]